jgi:hypothetical protein
MIQLATGTGTKRNLAAMTGAGWGLLLTPDRPEMRPGFSCYAIDNGAWGCHQRGVEWEPSKWLALVDRWGAGAEWAVLPDVVMGGTASLARSVGWLPQVVGKCPRWLIAVQDGMTDADLAPHLSPSVGVFVGGSTEWKEQSLPMWGRACRAAGAWLHVGRVNSARRIRLCAMAGADSIDGTSGTRFAKTVPKLDFAVRQSALVGIA